jgi:hypothetical protein
MPSGVYTHSTEAHLAFGSEGKTAIAYDAQLESIRPYTQSQAEI